MLGLFERIGYALEPIGLAIEDAYVKARCDVANHIVDVKLQRKLTKYAKARRESGDEYGEDEEDEKSAEVVEENAPEDNGGTSVEIMAKNFSSTLVPKPKYKRIISKRRKVYDGCIGK